MRRPLTIRLLLALTALVLAMLVNALPALADSLQPATVTLTMKAGSSTTVAKTYHLDALPGAADIVLAIDTTGSMGPAIAQAKADATNIVTQVQAQIPGARFAVVDFKDYPNVGQYPPFTFGGAGDYPYLLKAPFTSSAAVVSAAIGTMSASGGGDGPEAYNRTFFEAVNDPALVYNPAAVRFLIVLGDNIGHDPVQNSTFSACPNTSPLDPGRDTILGTADDIHTSAAINGLTAANDKLLMISYGSFLSCYSQLAGATGGTAVSSGGSGTLPGIIVNAIKAAAAHIGEAHLAVTGPCTLVTAGGSISFSPSSYTNVTAPVDLAFTETITAPTLVGTYTCEVQGFADGVPRGNPEEISVTVVAGAPAKVVLSPAAATNVVGEQHCETATVTDTFGNPVPNVSVAFNVPTSPATHASPSSGVSTTNASGEATFCFTASLPGVDEIDAAVDSNGNGVWDASDTPQAVPASKVWTLPPSTSFCTVKITNGGWIIANNGDRSNFGGNANVDSSGNPTGEEEYQDQGPAQPMNVHSTKITATTCDSARQHASIFGEATIDGSGTWIFRIDVTDMGEPSTNDAYGIMLSNGYDSGMKPLQGGNIDIH